MDAAFAALTDEGKEGPQGPFFLSDRRQDGRAHAPPYDAPTGLRPAPRSLPAGSTQNEFQLAIYSYR